MPQHLRQLRSSPPEKSAMLMPLMDAAPDRPYVVAQLGQSLDGRIATLTGASQWINRSSALDHLHRLRASVDAVIVGIGTVLADNPRLDVRRVSGRNPVRVVIDPSGRMPDNSACIHVDDQRVLAIRTTHSGGSAATDQIVLSRVGRWVEPEAILSELFKRGLRKVLIEGGAKTISTFMDAGAVDRLHVLVAPMIIGSGTSGLALQPITNMEQALRPETRVHVLDDGDVLFDCNLRSACPSIQRRKLDHVTE